MNSLIGLLATGAGIYSDFRDDSRADDAAALAAEREFTLAQQTQNTQSRLVTGLVAALVVTGVIVAVKKARP